LTLDDIASYCQFKDCRVHLGTSDAGFVTVDGEGVTGPLNNYRRFLALNELASLPNPRLLLQTATRFTVESGSESRTLERAEFERELQRFAALVEA
jgi:hypothetical protein